VRDAEPRGIHGGFVSAGAGKRRKLPVTTSNEFEMQELRDPASQTVPLFGGLSCTPYRVGKRIFPAPGAANHPACRQLTERLGYSTYSHRLTHGAAPFELRPRRNRRREATAHQDDEAGTDNQDAEKPAQVGLEMPC
jgi:hypothetical protein